MILMILWAFGSGWALVAGNYSVAIFLLMVVLLIALVIRIGGGFNPCPKCRSRFTERNHYETPDHSYGYAKMHPRIEQVCWNPRCRAVTVIQGISVTGSVSITDTSSQE